MDNPMELINTLMKNPNMLENIKNVLTEGGKNDEASVEAPVAEVTNTDVPDLSFLTGLIASNPQSAGIMSKMKSAYDAYSDRSDPNICLLDALSPFLGEKRAVSLDKIKNIVRIGKAASVITGKRGG